MKRPLFLLLTAALGAAAGWLTGAPPQATAPRIPGAQPRSHPGLAHRPAWAAQMAAVRAVPGEGAEVAWLQWAFTIPDAEVPAAIAMLNPRADFTALRCLYARWATLDPDSAWLALRSSGIPDNVTHSGILDLTEARGTGLPGMTRSYSPRSLIASRMLASWAAKDPTAAKAFAVKLTSGTPADRQGIPADGWTSNEVNRLTGKGAHSQDPAHYPEAAAKALALPPGEKSADAIEDATRTWLYKDPAAACAWLRSLPPDELSKVNVAGISYAFRSAAGSDKVQTLASAAYHSATDSEITATLRAMIEPVRSHYFQNDSPTYHAATGMKEWMTESPAAARAWLATQPESDLTAMLTGIAAGQLTRTDPAAALAMLNAAGGDQSCAVRAFVNGWTESDARAAAAWAAKIEDPPLRDEALQTAAFALVTQDPALAAQVAARISNAGAREQMSERFSNLLSWNPAAAEAVSARFPEPPINDPR